MKILKRCKSLKILEISLVLSFSINIFLGYFLWKKHSSYDLGISVLETYDLPKIMFKYREIGFKSTLIPTKSPFGGNGYSFTKVTSGFKSPSYYSTFGKVHWGVDLIPTSEYYEKSRAYRLARVPVIFATHNGLVKYYYDEFGANYIVVTNPIGNLRTLFVHLKGSYVKTGDSVVAGQPIGIMGATGDATGAHLHYAVQTKDDQGRWQYQDPQNFIF